MRSSGNALSDYWVLKDELYAILDEAHRVAALDRSRFLFACRLGDCGFELRWRLLFSWWRWREITRKQNAERAKQHPERGTEKVRTRPCEGRGPGSIPGKDTLTAPEPDGTAIGCNPIEVGSTPTGVSDVYLN